jgi:AcrR family transcriptional regulator
VDTHKSKQSDTKTRILDVAEQLFAENGFKRTSINLLARMAGVNQAAVNYYFGSKDGLVEQVIVRRAALIDQLRMEKLVQIKEAAEQSGQKPEISDVLRAFIEPAFRVMKDGENTGCFLLIAGRAFSEPDDAIRKIFIHNLKPSFTILTELMAQILPELPGSVLLWRLHFVIGAMAHSMRVCGTSEASSDFYPPADNAEAVMELMIPFLVHGMMAPVD